MYTHGFRLFSDFIPFSLKFEPEFTRNSNGFRVHGER